MKLPRARTANIVVQDLKNEVLIYDLQTHKAYNLNRISAIVYKACDGATEEAELKRKHKFTDDLIYLALDELKENDLLIEYEAGSHFRGLTRREAIRKVGLATMIALPLITTLVAPRAADAQSAGACVTNSGRCTFINYTQSNCCSGLRCYGSCADCIPSGGVFLPCSNCVPGSCDFLTTKNRCCNSGNAVYDGGCRCP